MLAPTNVFKLENILLFGLDQVIVNDSDGAYDMHQNQGLQKAYISMTHLVKWVLTLIISRDCLNPDYVHLIV